jgi:transcriptional regulator with XRE-family HTH domain
MTDCAALVVNHLRLRQRRNARYSLRAFARDLGVSHSTLSGVVSGRRPASARFVRSVATHLGLDGQETLALVDWEHARKLAAQVACDGFRPDLRHVAARSGLSVDALCVALHRLLSERRLDMTSAQSWTLRGAP